jgi:hypothetical protein
VLLYCLAHPTRARALAYISDTGIDSAFPAEYRTNQAMRLGPHGQRRLAELRVRRSQATAAYAALDREICALSWSADFANPAHVQGRTRQIFVADVL